jgi:acyl-CoA thioester hydrolase
MISTSTIDVRYPDTDAMGIVHHAVYPVWFEIARMDFFAAMGFSYTRMHTLKVNPPLVDLHISYRAAVSYPGQVTVKTGIRSYAPKKLELAYQLYSGETLVCTAETLHVWTGPDMKSMDMEQNLPHIYHKIQTSFE